MPFLVSLLTKLMTSTRRQWIRACLFGELVGFIPPAVAGAGLVAIDASEPVLVAGLVAAGTVEGAILGAYQGSALRALAPKVSGWTGATALAAGLAWLAGMGGSSLLQATGPLALIGVAPAWILALLAMGVLQARRFGAAGINPAGWITRTAAAWLLGVSIPVFALSVIPSSWPLAVHVVVGVVAAVLMGLTVGAVTAPRLARILGLDR